MEVNVAGRRVIGIAGGKHAIIRCTMATRAIGRPARPDSVFLSSGPTCCVDGVDEGKERIGDDDCPSYSTHWMGRCATWRHLLSVRCQSRTVTRQDPGSRVGRSHSSTLSLSLLVATPWPKRASHITRRCLPLPSPAPAPASAATPVGSALNEERRTRAMCDM